MYVPQLDYLVCLPMEDVYDSLLRHTQACLVPEGADLYTELWILSTGLFEQHCQFANSRVIISRSLEGCQLLWATLKLLPDSSCQHRHGLPPDLLPAIAVVANLAAAAAE